MSTKSIWELSKSERNATLLSAFAGMTPAEQKPETLMNLLRQIRPFIAQKRREGYSVEQICTALQHPSIALTASPVSVRRILVEDEKRRAQRRKARLAALVPRSASAPKPTP